MSICNFIQTATGTFRVPRTFDYGTTDDSNAFIIMEFLDFGGPPFDAALGKYLAELHLTKPKV